MVQSMTVLWLIGVALVSACKHPNPHKHQGHKGQSEQDNEEVQSVLNSGCLILTSRQESLV